MSVATVACPDTLAPSTPSNLIATSISATSVTLGWSQSVDNVGVAGYDVYQDAARVSASLVSPTYTFGSLTCGTSYTLGVDAYDAAGNDSPIATTSVRTSACADPVPSSAPSNPPSASPNLVALVLPALTFVSPAAGATVSGSVLWQVSSPVAFDHIDFSIDGGAVLWTEHTCPCDFNGDPDGRLDTTTLANGPHTLKVDAYDATGTKIATASETVTVSNGAGTSSGSGTSSGTGSAPSGSPPAQTTPSPSLSALTFVSPAAGATVSGSVLWQVSSPVAFDHIDFSIDGGAVLWTEHTCPCDFNGDPDGRLDTTTLANGPHTLKVDAYDAIGNEDRDRERDGDRLERHRIGTCGIATRQIRLRRQLRRIWQRRR